MSIKGWTLDELAGETGYEPRTIRSYIQQGILPRPTSLGRNASYTDRHRLLLLAQRYLRESEGYNRLADIRVVLDQMDPAELEDLARRVTPPKRDVPKDSALDFIRRQKEALASTGNVVGRESKLASGHTRQTGPPADVTQAKQAVTRFSTQAAPDPHLTPGHETWVRIPVVDGVDLNVRTDGPADPQRIARFEQLARQMQEQLERGTDHGT